MNEEIYKLTTMVNELVAAVRTVVLPALVAQKAQAARQATAIGLIQDAITKRDTDTEHVRAMARDALDLHDTRAKELEATTATATAAHATAVQVQDALNVASAELGLLATTVKEDSEYATTRMDVLNSNLTACLTGAQVERLIEETTDDFATALADVHTKLAANSDTTKALQAAVQVTATLEHVEHVAASASAMHTELLARVDETKASVHAVIADEVSAVRAQADEAERMANQAVQDTVNLSMQLSAHRVAGTERDEAVERAFTDLHVKVDQHVGQLAAELHSADATTKHATTQLEAALVEKFTHVVDTTTQQHAAALAKVQQLEEQLDEAKAQQAIANTALNEWRAKHVAELNALRHMVAETDQDPVDLAPVHQQLAALAAKVEPLQDLPNAMDERAKLHIASVQATVAQRLDEMQEEVEKSIESTTGLVLVVQNMREQLEELADVNPPSPTDLSPLFADIEKQRARTDELAAEMRHMERTAGLDARELRNFVGSALLASQQRATPTPTPPAGPAQYYDGATYEAGETVTHGNALWRAVQRTALPPTVFAQDDWEQLEAEPPAGMRIILPDDK